MKSKQQIIEWCNSVLSGCPISTDDAIYLKSIIALSNGEQLPKDYLCRKCNKYFCGVEEYSEYDEMGFSDYYVNCPHCGHKIYVGNDCYWR